MTDAEKLRAMSVSPKEYPQETPCAVCGYRWREHKGTLCVKRAATYFLLDMGTHLEPVPIPPVLGDTTFVPDLAYFSQNPDFDVI